MYLPLTQDVQTDLIKVLVVTVQCNSAKASQGAQMAITEALEAPVSKLRHWEIMAAVVVVMAVAATRTEKSPQARVRVTVIFSPI